MLYALIGHVKTTRFTGGYYFLEKIKINKINKINKEIIKIIISLK